MGEGWGRVANGEQQTMSVNKKTINLILCPSAVKILTLPTLVHELSPGIHRQSKTCIV